MKKSMLLLVAACAVFTASIAAAEGLETIEDVRVDALVSSRWGQKSDTGYSNTGVPCFNRYTPDNLQCGCSATAFAQLFRFWKYPQSIPSGEAKCLVNGVEQTLGYGGGAYDYDLMPFVPAGTGEDSLDAIGRLVYDSAVAMHSQFMSGSTYAFGAFSFVQLKSVFGYESAVGYVSFEGTAPTPEMERAIIANLDAKAPVMLMLSSSANGYAHQALVDGYGYHGGKLYFHFNLGWCNLRGEDKWYELNKSACIIGNSTYDYDIIEAVVYNVFPNASGDVLSGRVMSAEGLPAAGLEVKARLGGDEVGTATTDANGIYHFVLPGGKTYDVSCNGTSISVALPASSSAKRMVKQGKKTVEADIWENPFMPTFSESGTFGGSSGNDIVVTETPVDPEPAQPEDMGPFNPVKAGKGEYPYCGVVRDEGGNPCGTITVKYGKPSNKGVSKITAKLTMLDGKSYSLSSSPVDVSDSASAKIVGKAIKKFGVVDSLEIGARGFVAAFTKADGTRLTAGTTDLSTGLASGEYTFKLVGEVPVAVNGLPVLTGLLPLAESVSLNGRGKFALAKAATVKYVKVKGSTPAVYELVADTSKGKTNLSGLKLTYTAKTSQVKGSFNVYVDDEAKHKIVKYAFTVTGMVIDGKAVGLATCKKLAVSIPLVVE